MVLICNDVKVKMATIVGGTLYGKPMEGWCFAMIGMKNYKIYSNEGYALSTRVGRYQ